MRSLAWLGWRMWITRPRPAHTTRTEARHRLQVWHRRRARWHQDRSGAAL